MRPFKMFFGLSLAIMLFFFVAKFFVFAFIAAAIFSIIYAVFRRIKDFITYDRNGEYYIKGYETNPRFSPYRDNSVEPLFYGDHPNQYYNNDDIRFVDIH
jgi:hypothetical protein